MRRRQLLHHRVHRDIRGRRWDAGWSVRAVGATTGGCASSWAQGAGQLSTAAIVAQCREGIEARFGPYPIVVQFAETYQLRNRADCVSVMSGVAHGEIDPGNASLFPGGARP